MCGLGVNTEIASEGANHAACIRSAQHKGHIHHMQRFLSAIPKMMFMTGNVSPVPIDANVATTNTNLSSHVENEKIRWTGQQCHHKKE